MHGRRRAPFTALLAAAALAAGGCGGDEIENNDNVNPDPAETQQTNPTPRSQFPTTSTDEQTP